MLALSLALVRPPLSAAAAVALTSVAFAGVLLIVWVGTESLVLRSLRRFAGAVASWRAGRSFDGGAVTGLPTEIAEFARALEDAMGEMATREEEARRAAAQQALLMQEIHHRVKNNLQIVASLLNLQASRIRAPGAKAEFRAARDRVRALGTLHRHLYNEGELRAINMRSFLMELCGQLFQAMGEREGERIALKIDAPEMRMSSDQAVPLALIVTEAVSNAVKYAFPGGRSGHVAVHLLVEGEEVQMMIEDDGIGIPAGKGESESGPRDGLGIQLIHGFARQLGARLEVSEDGGTRYDLRMPLRHEPASERHEEGEPV